MSTIVSMRTFLLGSTMFAVAAAPANAESWYRIASGSDDIYYADASTVTRNGDTVEFKTFDGVYEPISGYSAGVYYIVGNMQFRCGYSQYKEGNYAGYDIDRKYVGQVDYTSDWLQVDSGTYSESLYQFGCNGTGRENAVTDPFVDAEDYWYCYDYYGFDYCT